MTDEQIACRLEHKHADHRIDRQLQVEHLNRRYPHDLRHTCASWLVLALVCRCRWSNSTSATRASTPRSVSPRISTDARCRLPPM